MRRSRQLALRAGQFTAALLTALVLQASAAPPSVPLPDPKYRVKKVNSNDWPEWDYCWLDARTILQVHSMGDESPLQFETVPEAREWHSLLAALRNYWSGNGRIHPDLDVVAAGRYVVSQSGRNYKVLDVSGKDGPEVIAYHTSLGWSPDGARVVSAWWGRNGSLKTYADVKISGTRRQTLPRRISNTRQHPLFVAHRDLAAAMTGSMLYVLSRPLPSHRIEEDFASDRPALWLLGRDLRILDGRTRKHVLKLPDEGVTEDASFSPNGERFALIIRYPDKHDVDRGGYLAVGRSSDGSIKALARLEKNADHLVLKLKWQPDGKHLSFIYDGWLYLMPVE